MADSATKTHAPCRCSRIRALNDQLRAQHIGGRMIVTRSVAAMCQDGLNAIFAALRSFDAFDADNDPYGEHDMGSLEMGGVSLLWKIDYYDRALQYASPDPSNPTVTTRVLTVMLAEEY